MSVWDRSFNMLQLIVVCFVIVNSFILSQVAGWPAGTYGLIQSRTGCPYGNVNWHVGDRYFDSEDSHNRDGAWPNDWNKFLAGQVNDVGITIGFCIKETYASSSVSTATTWPRGSYCILKYGSCPSGFNEGFIYWDDEDHDNRNHYSGAVPDGSYDQNTKMYFCCRGDGSYATPISLPSEHAFVLLRYGGNCQDVADMGITEVYIHWDNEDGGNRDEKGGAHPDEDGGLHDHRLHFCHYNPTDPVVG